LFCFELLINPYECLSETSFLLYLFSLIHIYLRARFQYWCCSLVFNHSTSRALFCKPSINSISLDFTEVCGIFHNDCNKIKIPRHENLNKKVWIPNYLKIWDNVYKKLHSVLFLLQTLKIEIITLSLLKNNKLLPVQKYQPITDFDLERSRRENIFEQSYRSLNRLRVKIKLIIV